MEILEGIGALLITNPVNIRYLTGFNGLAPQEREAYLLITTDKNILYTNALYVDQALRLKMSRHSAFNSQLDVVEVSRENSLSSALYTQLKETNITRLGFEEVDLTYAEYRKLTKELRTVEMIPTQNRIEDKRKIKLPDEIKRIKKACHITDKCFEYITHLLKPGVTESEIAWKIESYCRENKAENAFPPIVAFDKHTSQPHYDVKQGVTLQGYALKESAIILLDFGAKYQGYCSDMTRVVFLGKPSTKQRHVYETVLKAQRAALNKLATSYSSSDPAKPESQEVFKDKENNSRLRTNSKPAIFGASIDQAARDVIQKPGFSPYPHGLGHGVGLEIHEDPRLSVKHDMLLELGEVFSIEPGIYLEGEFGVRLEDLVCLHPSGLEVLSHSTKEIVVL